MTALYFWDDRVGWTKSFVTTGISIGEVELNQAIAQLADDWIPDNVLELSD